MIPAPPQTSPPPPPAPQQVLDAAKSAADAAADAAEQAVSKIASNASDAGTTAAQEVRETASGTAAVITRIGETLAGAIHDAVQSSGIPGFVSVLAVPIIAVSALILIAVVGATISIARFWADAWASLTASVIARLGVLPVLRIAGLILGQIGATLVRYANAWLPYVDVLSTVERLALDFRGRVPGLVHPGAGGTDNPDRAAVRLEGVTRALDRLEALLRMRRADAVHAASLGAVQRVRGAVVAARAAVLAARAHAARAIDPRTAAPPLGGPAGHGAPGGLSTPSSGGAATRGLPNTPRRPGFAT